MYSILYSSALIDFQTLKILKKRFDFGTLKYLNFKMELSILDHCALQNGWGVQNDGES